MASSRAPDPDDQRGAARFDTRLPVHIAGMEGATHNISAHGVCFEADVAPALGTLLNFTVEFNLHGHRQTLLCEGKVVRVEPRGGRVGVAARLVAPLFDGVEVAQPAKPR